MLGYERFVLGRLRCISFVRTITSTRSTSKFHINTFQVSVEGAVMLDAITYGQDCMSNIGVFWYGFICDLVHFEHSSTTMGYRTECCVFTTLKHCLGHRCHVKIPSQSCRYSMGSPFQPTEIFYSKHCIVGTITLPEFWFDYLTCRRPDIVLGQSKAEERSDHRAKIRRNEHREKLEFTWNSSLLSINIRCWLKCARQFFHIAYLDILKLVLCLSIDQKMFIEAHRAMAFPSISGNTFIHS